MAFKKTGISPIDEIRCSCGAQIPKGSTKCPGCGKSLLPPNLQGTAPTQLDNAEATTDKSTVK